MISLFTPGTGFPDLEAKIAFGLCRLGFESKAKNINLSPVPSGYKITLDANPQNLSRSYTMLLNRILAGKHLFELPGIQAKYIKNYPADINKIFLPTNLIELFNGCSHFGVDFSRSKMCRHTDIPNFGGSTGLILAASTHAGMPYISNQPKTNKNTQLCQICGYLTILGIFSGVFRFNLGGKRKLKSMMTPIPQTKLLSSDLEQLFSSKLVLEKSFLRGDVPVRLLPVAIMTKYPSITDIFDSKKYQLHSVLLEGGKTDRVISTMSSDPGPISKFLSYSSFNTTTLYPCVLNDPPLIDVLHSINMALSVGDTDQKRNHLMRFCRQWVSGVNHAKKSNDKKPGGYPNHLIYRKTIEYLLKEEVMISLEIIRDPAIKSFARTLRFFNSNKNHLNYGFVDNIRNASVGSDEFEKTIEKLLRTAQSVRYANEKTAQNESKPDGNVNRRTSYIHIPSDAEFIRLVELSAVRFGEVKTALVCLSLCRPEIKMKDPEGELDRVDISELDDEQSD